MPLLLLVHLARNCLSEAELRLLHQVHALLSVLRNRINLLVHSLDLFTYCTGVLLDDVHPKAFIGQSHLLKLADELELSPHAVTCFLRSNFFERFAHNRNKHVKQQNH